mmetsp:Transcript_5942/g.17626  ORF Transcript_5942/g.17626 Transcript_5942/m.17626 type:complete len:97 (-) Transcript_5942:585-875(-)
MRLKMSHGFTHATSQCVSVRCPIPAATCMSMFACAHAHVCMFGTLFLVTLRSDMHDMDARDLNACDATRRSASVRAEASEFGEPRAQHSDRRFSRR